MSYISLRGLTGSSGLSLCLIDTELDKAIVSIPTSQIEEDKTLLTTVQTNIRLGDYQRILRILHELEGRVACLHVFRQQWILLELDSPQTTRGL